MTSKAVVGHFAFLMTGHAKSHGVIHCACGYSHLGNISVAGCALDFGANMWSVIETHVRFIRPAINALPRDFFPALLVCGYLLNFRLVRCNSLVADHAILHAGYACHRPFIDANMAEITLELGFLDVRLVLVGDRLNGFRADPEKMTDSFAKRFVCRAENRVFRTRRCVRLRPQQYAR